MAIPLILDTSNPKWGKCGWLEERFGAPFDPLGATERHAFFGRNSQAGRGSEAGGRQGPESSPMTRDTCGTRPYGALCSMLKMDPPKKGLDPPPFKTYGALNLIMFL